MGKTKVWNKSGVRPQICDVLERVARDNDPNNEGSGKVLECFLINKESRSWATPLGHQDYVRSFLNKVSPKHQILFQRIPRLSDVQPA